MTESKKPEKGKRKIPEDKELKEKINNASSKTTPKTPSKKPSESKSPKRPSDPKKPKKEYSPSLGFNEVKSLHERVEKAGEKQAEYQSLASNDPRRLPDYFKNHAASVNFSLSPFEKEMDELIEEKKYEGFAQLGQEVIKFQYGKDVANYDGAFGDKTGGLLNGAPDRVFNFIVGRASKSRIEKLVGEYDVAKDHLSLKEREELLQKYGSQTDEGKKTRKKVRGLFDEKYRENYKGMESLFDAITSALQADYREYHEETTTLRKDVVARVSKQRAYATSAIGDSRFMKQILESEFTQGLPEDYTSQSA